MLTKRDFIVGKFGCADFCYLCLKAKAQEKLEERSRRFKRSRQDPPPEGKGLVEMARDRLRGLMAEAPKVGVGGEGRVADDEMGEGEDVEQEIIT